MYNNFFDKMLTFILTNNYTLKVILKLIFDWLTI